MTIKGEVWDFDNDHGTESRDLSTRRAKTKGRKVWLEARKLTPARRGGWYPVFWKDCQDAATARTVKRLYLKGGLGAVRSFNPPPKIYMSRSMAQMCKEAGI